MTAIISFLTTTFADGLGNALATIVLNIGFLAGSGVLLYFSIIRDIRRYRGGQYRLDKSSKFLCAILSAIVIAGICELNIWSAQNQSAQTEQAFFHLLLMLLDPILNISTLAVSPFPNFNLTGPNLLIRILFLRLIIFVICKAYDIARRIDKDFGGFLEKNIYNSLRKERSRPEGDGGDAENPDSEPNSGENSEDGSRDGSNDGSPESGDRSASTLLKALIKLIPGAGIVSGFLAYILGEDDTREAIKSILEAVQALLDTITLTSNLSLSTPGVVAFFSNFLYIILSICILAVYGVMIAAMLTFIAAAWRRHDQIMDWIIQRRKAIFLCAGVAGLLFLACAVVFLTASGFGTVKDVFLGIFQSHDVFDTLARFVLLVLSICMIVLMLGFVIVFSFFVGYLGIQIGKACKESLKDSVKVLKYAQILAFIILGVGSLLGVGYGYQSISNGLLLLFPKAQASVMSLLWVAGHILLLTLIVLAVLLTVLTLIRLTIGALAQFLTDGPDRMAAEFFDLIQTLVAAVIQFFHHVLLFLKHACAVAETVLRTLLQIFIGYSTESEKNRAIFVAACFASLASLLNTFFGLIDFYHDSTHVIPILCSFAIACAVQLAMLVFGMKAGEGLAEKIVAGAVPQQRSCYWTITLKVCTILICASIYIMMFCITWNTMSWGRNVSISMKSILPVSFLILAGAIFASVIIRQALDIRALVIARKAYQGAGRKEDNGTPTQSGQKAAAPSPGFTHGFKRIPPRFYLTAYLLLMIVSTGFAFNNLFGYYADQADLHEQVYDQVIDRAEQCLQLSQKTGELVSRYEQNTSQAISILESRAADAVQKLQSDLAILDSNVTAATSVEDKIAAQNLRDRHAGDTRDFDTLVESLKSYIAMDTEQVGNDVRIKIFKYSHFWGGNSQPSYVTTCIAITFGGQTNYIGQYVTNTPVQSVKITDGDGVVTEYELVDRIKDPDNSDEQSIAADERIREHANKYDIIEELLGLFDSQENKILHYSIPGDSDDPSVSGGGNGGIPGNSGNPGISDEGNGGSDEDNGRDVRQLLTENAALDGVRSNLAQIICRIGVSPSENGGNVAPNVTIQDLPHLVTQYLNEESQDEESPDDVIDKLAAYNRMSVQIDRMLAIYHILSAADPVLSRQEDAEQNEAPGAGVGQAPGEEEEASPEYTIRAYRSYAQGIAHSNFQISYDALLRGLGLNQYRDRIDVLYRSSMVAIFLLLICFLVDMMAFFGGLLLFKQVFLFEKNKKLEEVGYLNYDAMLTNLFTPPKGEPIRLLHLALIYRLIYGDPNEAHADLPSAMNEMEILHDYLNSQDFQTLYDETWKILRQMDITEKNMPDLQQWLISFVQKNGIDFDE